MKVIRLADHAEMPKLTLEITFDRVNEVVHYDRHDLSKMEVIALCEMVKAWMLADSVNNFLDD